MEASDGLLLGEVCKPPEQPARKLYLFVCCVCGNSQHSTEYVGGYRYCSDECSARARTRNFGVVPGQSQGKKKKRTRKEKRDWRREERRQKKVKSRQRLEDEINRRVAAVLREKGIPHQIPISNSNSFYFSREWRSIRYEALKRSRRKCEVCSRGKEDGVVLHVDHIKPRSKFPQLELELGNLQVLCEDCNLGKSNTDSIDWRN